ncbi:MAG TPA: hypothetical protein VFX15_03115 [Actinomycetes bacterium]|nr:hypothetical protein [Actinomycetes bacterium]
MTSIDATMSLIDEDQGVCMDGHECGLDVSAVTGELRFSRVCPELHPFFGDDVYVGPPLIRWDITKAEIDDAARRGAHPDIVEWALSSWRDRQ